MSETTTARTTRRHLLAAAALTLTAGLPTTADTEADAPMKHIVLLGDSVFDNAAYVAVGLTSSSRYASGFPPAGGRRCGRWTAA